MTAVAIVYTSFGFAIAADGKRSWSHAPNYLSQKFESDAVQKIFSIESGSVALAYSIRGDTVSENGVWDIAAEIENVSKDLNPEHFRNSTSFLSELSALLQRRIEASRYMTGGYPNTQLCFVGYFKDAASWVDVNFHLHVNHLGQRYAIHSWQEQRGRPLEPGDTYLSGSEILTEMIKSLDPTASHLFRINDPEGSLEDAIHHTRAYVERCCSPLIRQLEPDGCKTVGGHIHVATVVKPVKTSCLSKLFRKPQNPHGGFKWVTPPLGVISSNAL